MGPRQRPGPQPLCRGPVREAVRRRSRLRRPDHVNRDPARATESGHHDRSTGWQPGESPNASALRATREEPFWWHAGLMTRRGPVARKSPARRMLSTACATVLLACGGLVGCTSRADLDGSTSSPLPPSSSGSGTREPANPAPGSTAPGTAGPAETTTGTGAAGDVPCAGDQRRALWRMPMFEVTFPVTASTTGFSTVAGRRAREDAARTAERLRAACGFVPPAARRYVREVRRLTATAFDYRKLELLLQARLQWARTVDRERSAARDLRELRSCRALKDDVTVSWRVWWRWTETGRAWWVELTWDNRTGKTVVAATLKGAARVTGLLPDAFGWSAKASSTGPGRHEPIGWGGSSSDTAWIKPGRSRLIIAPGADQDVHTTATGTFHVTDVEVQVYSPAAGICAVPVPPTS
jgi:hypothetical protein